MASLPIQEHTEGLVNRMAKNAYAKKITAASKQAVEAYRLAVIRRCIDTMWMSMCVTLNRKDGWGDVRLKRLRADFEETMQEYGVMQDSVDTDYADGKLEEVYKAIMKEDN